MKKHILIGTAALLSLFAFQSKTHAQALGHEYKTGIGIKAGYLGSGAIDIKHFLKPTSAIEGLFSFSRDWFMFTGLYEYHGNISGAPGLKWYVGPGAHLGFHSNHYKNHHHDSDEIFGGIDGVLGLDYKFNKAPISISLDVQPALNFPNTTFNVWGGLGIRFTL